MAAIRQREKSHAVIEEPTPQETGDVQLSDPQEFVFLPPRQGRTWSREMVETRIRDVRARIVEHESRDGEAQHELGTMLRELYGGFAERVKGRASFADLAMAELDMSRARVYQLLRLAASTTQAQARAYGLTRSLLGLRLLELTGVQTFEALSRKPLRTETADEVFFLPRTPKRHLESAVRVLVTERADAARADRPRGTVREVHRLNRELQRLLEDDPVLHEAKVKYVASREGHASLSVRLDGLEQRKAFARLLPKLLRFEVP